MGTVPSTVTGTAEGAGLRGRVNRLGYVAFEAVTGYLRGQIVSAFGNSSLKLEHQVVAGDNGFEHCFLRGPV